MLRAQAVHNYQLVAGRTPRARLRGGRCGVVTRPELADARISKIEPCSSRLLYSASFGFEHAESVSTLINQSKQIADAKLLG